MNLAGSLFDLARYQWDFITYFHAVKVFDAGQNPYDTALIARSAGRAVLPFVYPPQALFFFKLFAWLPLKQAAAFFVVSKFLALAALVTVWQRYFIKEAPGVLFPLFVMLSFNGAVFADLASGNPAMFEQLMLWGAFALYLERRYAGFCALILAAACLKVQPLLFLALLWFTDERKRAVYFFGALALYAAGFAAFYALRPELVSGFAANLTEQNTTILYFERGAINPSNFAFLEDMFKWLRASFGVQIPVWGRALIHEGFIVLPAYAAVRVLRSLQRGADDGRLALFFFILTYAILLPRFKDYSYTLLMVPAFYALRRYVTDRKVFAAAYVACLLPTAGVEPRLVWEYYAFILALGFWGIYYHALDRRPSHV